MMQSLLISVPPYHDIYYRSLLYLHPSLITDPQNFVGHATSLMTWQHDWQRQLLIHPPGNYSVYWVWTLLFGDSIFALASLSMLVGYSGLFLWHRFLKAYASEKIANAVIGLVAVSVSFNWYALMPIDAIFEFTAMAMGLCGVLFFLRNATPSFGAVSLAFLVQITALLFSYQYLLVILVLVVSFLMQKQRSLAVSFGIIIACVVTGFLHSLLMGKYQTFDHWPRDIGVFGVMDWYRQLPFTVLHWGVQPIAKSWYYPIGFFSIIGLTAQVFKGTRDTRSKFEDVLLPIVFVSPLVVYTVLIYYFHAFGHQRNLFYLLPIYLYFLVLPLSGQKILPLASILFAMIFLVVGWIANKGTITFLFQNTLPMQASILEQSRCVAIESSEMFLFMNRYEQATALRDKTVVWFKPGQAPCISEQPICPTFTIYSRENLDLKCGGALRRVSLIQSEVLLPWWVNKMLAIRENVNVYESVVAEN